MPAAPPAIEELDWEHRDFDKELENVCAEARRTSRVSPVDWDEDEEGGAYPAVMACHDGRFVRFILYRTVFEITSKYGHPISYVGGGSYGTVCYAFDLTKGKKVAIKKIADAFADAIQAKMALREVMLLRHMNHPNIVKLLDIIPPAHRRAFHDVYITSELIHIDMHKVIHSWTLTVDLSHDRCKHYLFQLLCGMKYLHSRNVLHRDLKPSNLLLSADGVLKICDFGQARTISKNHHKMTKLVGTLSYKAPEVLLHSSEYNSSIDVWSMGVIFVELILGTTLFRAADNEGQLGLILELVGTPTEDADLSFLDSTAISDVRRQPHHPKQLLSEKLAGVNQLAANLIEKMLKFDPRQRITIQEAMGHPYFQGFHDPTKYSVCPAPSFEEQMSIEEIQDLIYNEALALNPEFRLHHQRRLKMVSSWTSYIGSSSALRMRWKPSTRGSTRHMLRRKRWKISRPSFNVPRTKRPLRRRWPKKRPPHSPPY